MFFDLAGIASGSFERSILENIRSRAHFLVLLTPSALEDCSRPDDWLRREIEVALDSQRNIVPVMLEGFDFGTRSIANHLTGSLAPLASYNALPLPVEYFDEAMARLRERYLNVPLDAVLHTDSRATREVARQQQHAATVAPVVEERELTAQRYFEQTVNAVDPDEKIQLYSRATRLKPDYAFAFNNRGLLRKEQGDVGGAREDYDTAIRLAPGYPEAVDNRGILGQQQGDLAGAQPDFGAAKRLRER